MNTLNPNYLIHIANVLLLAAYSVRDILWLRLFAVASSLFSIPYFLLQPKPLWAALSWSVFFAAINLFQSWRLFIERRPVKLTHEEEKVRRLVFEDLPARKVLQVLGIGEWTTSAIGERLLECGKPALAISLIVNGRVRMIRDKMILGDLTTGDIVGSAVILNGIPSDVDAVAVEPVQAVRWAIVPLQRYLDAHPDTRIVMQRHLARDLAGKLLGRSLVRD